MCVHNYTSKKPNTDDLMNEERRGANAFLKKTKLSSHFKQLPYLGACAFFGIVSLTTVARADMAGSERCSAPAAAVDATSAPIAALSKLK